MILSAQAIGMMSECIFFSTILHSDVTIATTNDIFQGHQLALYDSPWSILSNRRAHGRLRVVMSAGAKSEAVVK